MRFSGETNQQKIHAVNWIKRLETQRKLPHVPPPPPPPSPPSPPLPAALPAQEMNEFDQMLEDDDFEYDFDFE